LQREAKGELLRWVEEMEVPGEKASLKTKENIERYSEKGF